MNQTGRTNQDHAPLDWASVFEQCPWALLVLDDHACIQDANPAAERMFGISAAALAGRELAVLANVSALPRDGLVVLGSTTDANGLVHQVSVSTTSLMLPNGDSLWLGALSDLSSAASLADERLRMAELTGILRTIATVNHQINNPLFGMIATLQLLRHELGPDMPASVTKKLDRMAECCDRIKAITEQLGQVVSPARQTYIATEDMLDLTNAVVTAGHVEPQRAPDAAKDVLAREGFASGGQH